MREGEGSVLSLRMRTIAPADQPRDHLVARRVRPLEQLEQVSSERVTA